MDRGDAWRGSFPAILWITIVTTASLIKAQSPDDVRSAGIFQLEKYNDEKRHSEATEFCKKRNSWLLEVKTPEIQEALRKLMGNQGGWIGGKFSTVSNSWQWGDGTSLVYSNWLRHYSPRSNLCIEINYMQKWTGLSCNERRRFICQSVIQTVVFIDSKELYFYSDKTKTRKDASAVCEGRNSHLVDILTDSMDARITKELKWRKATKKFYTGGTYSTNRWEWTNGDRIDKYDYNWAAGEPNGYGTEKCLAKSGASTREWIDITCSSQNSYICEKDVVGNQCSEDICSNRGVCTVQNSGFRCHCSSPYNGRKCEINVCEPNPCNGGQCRSSAQHPYYACTCRDEYGGTFCTERKFIKHGNCQYHINSYEGENQQRSREICQHSHASLALIKGDEIGSFLETRIEASQAHSGASFWIGGQRQSAGWKWADGTTIISNKLEDGSGNCLTLTRSSTMSWNPMNCEETSGFICEKPVWTLPCDHCLNGGSCINIGCHNKCNCLAGYDGAECGRDLISITLLQKAITVNKGESADIPLYITSHVGRMNITFYKSNVFVSSKYSDGGRVTYHLGSFTSASSGIKCTFKVKPVDGVDFERKAYFNVVVLAPAKISRIDPESLVVPTYSNHYMRCEASGEPRPTVLWYKGEDMVPHTSTDGVYQSSRSNYADLVAYHATLSDAGVYTCKANNTIGEKQTSFVDERRAYMRMKLQELPVDGQKKEHFFTEEANLACSFTAFPKAEIRWRIIQNHVESNISSEAGSVFTISTEIRKNEVTSSLKIALADCLGPASITCTGENSFESVKSTFTLNPRVRALGNNNFIFSKTSEIGTLEESYSYCRNFNATLAAIPDKQTDYFMKKHVMELQSDAGAYIGGRRTTEGGVKLWKWPNGKLFYNETKHGKWSSNDGRIIDGAYVGWFPDRPASNEDQSCVYFTLTRQRNDILWSNYKCGNLRQRVCEKPMTGTPRILSARAGNCSASVYISWKPAQRGVGIKHRIVLEHNMSDSAIKPKPVDILAVDQVHKNEFRNLSYSTTYFVKVYVCPDHCMDTCHSVEEVTTGAGVPGRVKKVNLTQSESSSECVVSWSPPFISIGVTFYRVTATAELMYFTSEAMRNHTEHEVSETSADILQHTHIPLPNRKYEFKVQAGTCAGVGQGVIATGRCVTERAAPIFVPTAKISSQRGEDGTVDMTLPAIDESNGPISCIFIVAVKNPDSSSSKYQNYGEAQILQASENAQGHSVESEYITLAMSSEEFSNKVNALGEMKVRIGDNSTSKCNVGEVASIRRSKRETDESQEFSGWNVPLSKDDDYGFITFTSTPVGGGKVQYKGSDISIHGENESQSSGWIAGVVIGLLALMALVIVVIFLLRRGKNTIVTTNNRPMPMATVSQSQEPVYANLANESKKLRSDTDIPLERLESVYNAMKADDNKGFHEEYQKLRNEANLITLSTETASRASLKKKNRYKNILPYEKTRVKLRGNGSYINASFIEGFSQANKFIATQGPLPGTVGDFWRMVVEQKCHIIVMLTNCYEKGKKKCEKYWPHIGESKLYGNITVRNEAEEALGSFVKRTLRVTDETKNDEIVEQFQFLKWPDHGVPMTTSRFFRFQDAVSESRQRNGTNPPMIVHCSAGAGRTGAFIAYDYLTEERQNFNHVDVYGCVLNMRKQRVDMVQNCDQYIFIHKILLESYLFWNTDMRPDQAASLLNSPENEERISEEFNNLSVIGPIQAKLYGAHHDLMNRNKNIVPYEENHVIVVRMGNDIDTPYLNASVIESYDSSYKMVAAQGPVEASIENFWRGIFDNDVSVVIMLSKCKEGHKEQCAQYWPTEVGDSLSTNNISVEMKLQYLENDIVVRELHVTKENQSKKVMQYHYKSWSSATCPSNPEGVLRLADKMLTELNKIRANNAEPTALIHCSDGAGRTGAFCAIVNLIERLNVESSVDVFREAKDLRDCRPGMVQTLEQYRFCYQAVAAYVEASQVNSNFYMQGEEKVYENV